MARIKQPKPPKIPRPKTKELRVVYRELVSANVAIRLNTLARALQWYDLALPYIISRSKSKALDAQQTKHHDWALKCRKQALGTTFEGEKETAFRKAIGFYQKICVTLHPPDIEKFYKLFEAKRERLESKQERATDKFSNVLHVLQTWLQPKNAKGEPVKIVVADMEASRRYEIVTNQWLYNRATAKTLAKALHRRGVLPLLMQELPYLSRPYATEVVEEASTTGAPMKKYVLNPVKQLEAYNAMLQNLLAAASTPQAPKRLVRRAFAPVEAAKTADASQATQRPRVKRVFAGKAGAERVGGRYIVGSAMATIWSALKDGQWKQRAEVKALIPHVDSEDRIKKLFTDGQRSGAWTVEQSNDGRLRMILSNPVGATAGGAA